MQSFVTPEEYLAEEVNALEKHEYFKGAVNRIRSKTFHECRIITNVFMSIRNCLNNKKERIFLGGLRMHVQKNTLFTYPDLTIYCEPIITYNGRDDVATNPTVIINILPADVLINDYRNRFLLYQDLPSLSEYIIVASTGILVEHYIKQEDNKWQLSLYKQKGDVFTIQSIDFITEIGVFYENADFDEA